MERLTFDGKFCDIALCSEVRYGSFCEDGSCSQRRVWERLKSIEDILGDDYDLDRIQELAQAGREGRLVMLDEPRKPLIWGDDNHDSILCPNCKHDLMGGFQEADSCEVPMYQCPYCGQPIDGTQALTHEEAETALKGENHEANPV